MTNKLLVIDLVGLNAAALAKMPGLQKAFAKQAEPIPLQPPLPALTCSAQATLLTGALPQQHGIVSNGWFFEETGESRFWLRSDRLVRGEKDLGRLEIGGSESESCESVLAFCHALSL